MAKTLEPTLRKVKPTGEDASGRDADGRIKRNSRWSPWTFPARVPFGAFSAYEVVVGKRVIGLVCAMREEAERYVPGSRLRHPNGVSRYFIAEAFWRPYGGSYRSDSRIGYHHYSQADAVRDLVRAWEKDGRPRAVWGIEREAGENDGG